MGVHIALQPVTTLTSTLAAPTTLGAMNQTLPDARIGFNQRDPNGSSQQPFRGAPAP